MSNLEAFLFIFFVFPTIIGFVLMVVMGLVQAFDNTSRKDK